MLNTNCFPIIVLCTSMVVVTYSDFSGIRSNSFEVAGINLSSQSEPEEKLYKSNNRLPFAFCGSVIPILRNRFCDGKKDCPDGSDETSNSCKDKRCSKDQFRCEYGACISKKHMCDGIFNCADGSDEEYTVCKANNCVIPLSTASTTYYVLGCSNCREGTEVGPGTILESQCLNNFVAPFNRATCECSKWIPSVPTCNKNATR